jgi:hypothetical protein
MDQSADDGEQNNHAYPDQNRPQYPPVIAASRIRFACRTTIASLHTAGLACSNRGSLLTAMGSKSFFDPGDAFTQSNIGLFLTQMPNP